MNIDRIHRLALAALGLIACMPPASSARAEDMVFLGACDASAGWALASDRIVVASDEDDRLRIYLAKGGAPIGAAVDLDPLLAQDRPRKEADLEAVARLGDRLFWIGSHGRDSKGDWEAGRHRIVATDLKLAGVGRAVTELDGALRRVGLDAALGREGQDDKNLAPEKHGLNIEGLAAAPDGRSLLLGLRNPRNEQGHAMVVPFLNPLAAVKEGTSPELGQPIPLALGGLGIRDLVWSPERKQMLVLAGSSDDEGVFALYRWSGDSATAPVRQSAITGLRPEAIVLVPGRSDLLLLSDDGDQRHSSAQAECDDGWKGGTCPCKALIGDAKPRQQFRGRWVASE